jgi:hypothetical protein
LTETQIWQVSVLLANSDKIPASVKSALTSVSTAPAVAPVSGVAPIKVKP